MLASSLRAHSLVCLSLLLFSSWAQAETAIVDNRANAFASNEVLDTTGAGSAQAFTTGPDGLVFESVVVKLNAALPSTVGVKLWSGSGAEPVTLLEDLGTQNAGIGAADFKFISASRPELDASTRYWISVENVSGDFAWTLTADGATPSGDGTIEDLSRETADGGVTWPVAGATGEFRRFAVFGVVAGEVDTTFSPPTFSSGLTTIVPLSDGTMLIGGFFTDLGGAMGPDLIARLDENGALDDTFTPPTGLDNYVQAIAVQEDGKILVGGHFTDVGGDADLDRLIRLEADGTLDESFTPPAGLNGFVLSILPLADGKILVAGGFSDVGGDMDLDHVMRLNADGTVDDTFTPQALSNVVYGLALQDDGKILVGGSFTDVGGDTDLDRIIRLEENGTLDSSFTPPAGLSALVNAIALQADGKILVGGQFLDVDAEMDQDRLIRLETNGTLDTSFTPPTLGNAVNTIVAQADGKILVGGRFKDAGGDTELDFLIRVEDDGSVDPAFDSQVGQLGGGALVNCVVVDTNGKLLVGGVLGDAGEDTDLTAIFRAEYGGGKRTLTEPSLGQLEWTHEGTSPEPYRVIFEASTNGGASFKTLGEGTRTAEGWAYAGANIPAVATIRSRAFVRMGASNGSIHIVEDFLSIAHTSKPKLKLKGKKKILTSRGKLNLRGIAIDADGDLKLVQFKDSRERGKRFRKAKGTDRWLAKVKLKDGRNKVLVQAIDSRGVKSKALKVTLIKR